MSEATECWECNSALDWEGDIPDEESDVLCHDCEKGRLRASLAAADKALASMADERNEVALAAALTDAKLDEIRNLLRLLEASRGAVVSLLVYVETLELTLQSIRSVVGTIDAGGSDGV